jgi:DNA-directed RNA polymerase specialized sigma subunit
MAASALRSVTDAQIEALIPRVWAIVRREFNLPQHGLRDLHQAGMEGVCKAARSL